MARNSRTSGTTPARPLQQRRRPASSALRLRLAAGCLLWVAAWPAAGEPGTGDTGHPTNKHAVSQTRSVSVSVSDDCQPSDDEI